jgi:hypothetical protein
MQDRVAAGNIKVWQTTIHFTEIKAVIEGVLHLLPSHGIQFFTGIAGKNVTVLAPLVTFVRDMPLKSEILFHLILASLSLSIKKLLKKTRQIISAGNFMDNRAIICPRHRTHYHRQPVSPPACQKRRMLLASLPVCQKHHMLPACQNLRKTFHKRKLLPPQPSLSIQINLKVPCSSTS